MKEFLELVEKMRTAQKKYFETRDPNWLSEAKTFERKVDKRIFELKNQTELFNAEKN